MTVPARCNYNAAALTTTTTAALYTILHPGVMGEATTATTAAALKKRYSNHLSVHQWMRSAVGMHNHRPLLSSYFWNFCHRLVRYYWYTFIHVYIYIYICVEGWSSCSSIGSPFGTTQPSFTPITSCWLLGGHLVGRDEVDALARRLLFQVRGSKRKVLVVIDVWLPHRNRLCDRDFSVHII